MSCSDISRTRASSLPIIFLTGHGDIPMSVRAIKAGATDFLTKPVDAAALVQAVRAALQLAEIRHQASGRNRGVGGPTGQPHAAAA